MWRQRGLQARRSVCAIRMKLTKKFSIRLGPRILPAPLLNMKIILLIAYTFSTS